MNTQELNFAYKVRHVLNENLENLAPSTIEKLALSRAVALSHKKDSALPAPISQSLPILNTGSISIFGDPIYVLGRLGRLAIPLIVLAAGLIGIYQFEQQRRISEIADIDVAVLSDELPLSAYLDHGFNAYLATRSD